MNRVRMVLDFFAKPPAPPLGDSATTMRVFVHRYDCRDHHYHEGRRVDGEPYNSIICFMLQDAVVNYRPHAREVRTPVIERLIAGGGRLHLADREMVVLHTGRFPDEGAATRCMTAGEVYCPLDERGAEQWPLSGSVYEARGVTWHGAGELCRLVAGQMVRVYDVDETAANVREARAYRWLLFASDGRLP
jgi:hypothetical protein